MKECKNKVTRKVTIGKNKYVRARCDIDNIDCPFLFSGMEWCKNYEAKRIESDDKECDNGKT